MKESDYNIYLNKNGKDLVFNSMTCSFAEIEDEYFDTINNLESISDLNSPILENMKLGGFVVPTDLNEVDELKIRSYSGKFGNNGLGLTIAPTLMCNFKCPYCYETPENGIMSKEIQDNIVVLIEKTAKNKEDINITWYGGEPTLAIDIIEDLSRRIIKICNKENVNYNSYMISNGYLIDEDMIKRIKASSISGIQVTLDGPPKIHDTRRIPANKTPTFFKILKNIKIWIKYGITPDIRINVDKTNINNTKELLDIFREEHLQTCNLHFGHVTAYTEACQDISENCFEVQEFAREDIDWVNLLKENGFEIPEYPNYPGIKGNYCTADYIDSFVIDPSGELYKCWNDIGNIDRSVGNIKSLSEGTIINNEILNRYLLWNPFEYEKCLQCKILPICMGGCPYTGIKRGDPECEKWKYSLEETLINSFIEYEKKYI